MRPILPDLTTLLAAQLPRFEGLFESGRRFWLCLLPAWILLLPIVPHSGLAQVSPYLLLIPSVLLAGGLGGGAPGLIATVIGLACAGFGGRIGPSPVWQAVTFAGIGLSVATFGEMLRASRREVALNIAAVEAREQRLQSILDTVPDAMVLIDGAGEIQAFSKTAERLFGYTAAEVRGRNVRMLMPSGYRDSHDGYLERYARTGEKRIIGIGRIVVAERRDGSTFPIELAVGEVKGRDGSMFTGFIRDLSERQSTEARLQELQAELVHMSRLTALGEMSSALAHELNQPLSAIANYLKGVRRLLEPSAQDPVQSAARGGDHPPPAGLRPPGGDRAAGGEPGQDRGGGRGPGPGRSQGAQRPGHLSAECRLRHRADGPGAGSAGPAESHPQCGRSHGGPTAA